MPPSWVGVGEARLIHFDHSQQCHEPTGRTKGTKAMQGHPTRPVCKVTFSQSGPTTIRSNLNHFLAWLHRTEGLDQDMDLSPRSTSQQVLASRPEPKASFILHFDWFGIHLPKLAQASLCHVDHLHIKKIQDAQTLKIWRLFSLPVTKIWIAQSRSWTRF